MKSKLYKTKDGSLDYQRVKKAVVKILADAEADIATARFMFEDISQDFDMQIVQQNFP